MDTVIIVFTFSSSFFPLSLGILLFCESSIFPFSLIFYFANYVTEFLLVPTL